MLNENLLAICITILAFGSMLLNPDNDNVILLVLSNFLAFLGGKSYEKAKNSKDKEGK